MKGMHKSKGSLVPRQGMRRIWRTSLISLGVLLVGAAGIGVYEYVQLQPEQHFRNLPTLAPGPSSNKSHPQGAVLAASTQGSSQHSGANVTLPPGVFNVLLVGSDIRHGSTAGHSDSMMIVHVDLRTHQYNILSVPRDARVHLAGYGYTKLTSVQYIGQATQGTVPGLLDAIQAITQLTGIPINYYAETDYWGLQVIVNAIGGIQMYVPFNVTLTHPWYSQDAGKFIAQGQHFFNGRMVTEVVHERYSVPGTDYGRQKLQEQAMVGIAKTLLTPGDISKLPAVLHALPKYLIATNMSVQDMLSLALANRQFHSSEVHYYQLPGTSEVLYDNILQANNDQVVLNVAAMKAIVAAHFLG